MSPAIRLAIARSPGTHRRGSRRRVLISLRTMWAAPAVTADAACYFLLAFRRRFPVVAPTDAAELSAFVPAGQPAALPDHSWLRSAEPARTPCSWTAGAPQPPPGWSGPAADREPLRASASSRVLLQQLVQQPPVTKGTRATRIPLPVLPPTDRRRGHTYVSGHLCEGQAIGLPDRTSSAGADEGSNAGQRW